MKPAKYDLTIYRDRDFSQTFYLKSQGTIMDLTDYTVRSEMRPGVDSDTLILAFTTAINIPSGSVTISLTDVQTLALDCNTAYFDLVLTKGTLRQSYIQGAVKVVGTVTREPEA
ncbi:MAG: hypothetical protein WC356_02240 [Candidatus Micrarchaeia archaeon]|jgi:hypothetical protein